MKRLLIFIIPIIFTLEAFAQVNQGGNHFINNIGRNTYNAELQNWDITQDQRGVIYVGNGGFILEYDGENWRKIPGKNSSAVRSLAVDKNNRVYAGRIGDFGYLKPTKKGALRYHSLARQVDVSFKDIWKTYTKGDTVWFCSYSHIFKYKSDSLLNVVKAPAGNFFDFMLDTTLYLGVYDKGLMKLQDDTIKVAKGGSFFKKKDIFFIMPYRKNAYFVGVNGQGLYVYNKKTGDARSAKFLGDSFQRLNEDLKKMQLYDGIRLSDGNYAITTLDNGLVIFDGKTGEKLYHYTDINGLQDKTVITAFQSKNNNLWLGLNNGLAHIFYQSPVRYFGKDDKLQGIPLHINRYNNSLVVGSSQGVLYKGANSQGFPVFNNLPGIDNQTWSILPFKANDKSILLAGTHKGIYDISQLDKARKILGKDDYLRVYTLRQSRFRPKYLITGVYRGIALLKYTENGWQDIFEMENIDATIHFTGEANESTLWASSNLKGIYKIEGVFTEDTTRIRHMQYDTTEGLPAEDRNKVFDLNGELFFGTKEGFYNYMPQKDRFEKAKPFNGRYADREIINMGRAGRNAYWIISKSAEGRQEIEKISMLGGKVHIMSRPFKRLSKETYQNIYLDDRGVTWFAASDRIIGYNASARPDSLSRFPALIRNVTLGFDSLLFQGTYYQDTMNYHVSLQQPEAIPSNFPYSDNNISFTFAAPFFEKSEEIVYSFRLDGYDRDWSNWTPQTDKEYTNLDEGSYTFKVKARNVYGKVSETASFRFTIAPPWYRTYWAYIVYVILAGGLIYLIIQWYTRRLKREKERLEEIVQERTKEVVKQKEQIEHQKDELEGQRDEISRKNKDIMDSIEYASKIQNAILPDEAFTEEILPGHFIFFRPRDVVSGDFYWISESRGYLVIIAADCTGHGVPGAFMSMLGVALLNDIVNRKEPLQANLVLNELREQVKTTLKQRSRSSETKDGMDMAMTIVDTNNMKMQFAGAYNPLIFIRNGELHQYKADRMPIGVYIREKPTFTNHEIDLQKGDTFYIFSDGYQDQFGGENGSKFKSSRLKELFLDIHEKPMKEQKQIMEKTLNDWKGERDQLDDIIVIGVRL